RRPRPHLLRRPDPHRPLLPQPRRHDRRRRAARQEVRRLDAVGHERGPGGRDVVRAPGLLYRDPDPLAKGPLRPAWPGRRRQPVSRLGGRLLHPRRDLGLPDDRGHEPRGLPEHLRPPRGGGAGRGAAERRRAERVGDLEVLEERGGGQRVRRVRWRPPEGGDDGQPRLQPALPPGPVPEAHAGHRHRPQAPHAPGHRQDHLLLRLPGPDVPAGPGGPDELHHPRHVHARRPRPGHRGHGRVGDGRDSAHLRQAPSRLMGEVSAGDKSERRAALAIGVPAARVAPRWWRSIAVRRFVFGYSLLTPDVLYVGLLVGVPFLFSLYLALSDASVGAPIARFVGIDNLLAAVESSTFRVALRNSLVFTLGAGIAKSVLGTTLAFLLMQRFRGRKVVRALLVMPFTIPIAVSALGWKWMLDSQFSVINWALGRFHLIGAYGTDGWPVWLGQPA